MTGPLTGRTALITGSTRRGIGAATAMRLGEEGANIVLNYGTGDRSAEARKRADDLRTELRERGIEVGLIEAAVHSETEVVSMFRQASDQFGAVDILVNNAGGRWIEQDFANIHTDHCNQAVRSEVDGTFYCIRAALPSMRSRRWGRIVNVCLDFDAMALLVNAHYGHELDKFPYDFAIAKQAKREFAHRLALPELKHGITINNIMPGIIEDLISETAVSHSTSSAAGTSRFYSPSDVAGAIAFRCHDEARAITRSDIHIPGNIYTRL